MAEILGLASPSRSSVHAEACCQPVCRGHLRIVQQSNTHSASQLLVRMQCSAHRRHCCTACLQVHVLFSCVKAWPTRSPPPDAPRRCPRPRRPHLHRLGCRRRCRRRQHRRRPCRRHHCRRRRHPHLRNRPSPPPPAPPPSELSCAESRECGPVRRCARGCRACSAPQPNRERRPAWDVSARAGALRTTARGVARARMPVRLPRVASARRRRASAPRAARALGPGTGVHTRARRQRARTEPKPGGAGVRCGSMHERLAQCI